MKPLHFLGVYASPSPHTPELSPPPTARGFVLPSRWLVSMLQRGCAGVDGAAMAGAVFNAVLARVVMSEYRDHVGSGSVTRSLALSGVRDWTLRTTEERCRLCVCVCVCARYRGTSPIRN